MAEEDLIEGRSGLRQIRKGIDDSLTISTVSGAGSYLLNMLGPKIYP